MRNGGKALAIGASLAVVGCASASSKLEVRQLPDPSAKLHQGSDELAAAQSMLALGSVGLALEGFREVQRRQPNDPRPLAGIAACYSAMGRYDIAEQNYEAALALAPEDPSLLRSLADIFAAEGQEVRAAQTRSEAARIASAATQTVVAPPAAAAPPPIARPSPSITVALPPARPAVHLAASELRSARAAIATADPQPVLLPAARPADHLVASEIRSAAVAIAEADPQPTPVLPASSVTVVLPPARPIARLTGAEITSADVSIAEAETVFVRPASAITVDLPPARRTEHLAAGELRSAAVSVAAPEREAPAIAENATVSLPPPQPEPRQPAVPRAPAQPLLAPETTSPRLVRLSRGEVALVTTDAPVWKPQMASNERTTVTWIPLQNAAHPNIQILNAARREGVAAKARTVLLDRGWRRIAVGDAPAVKEESVVLYPASHRRLGKSLAAQFGCRAIESSRVAMLTVFIGRDAALKAASHEG